VEIVWEERKHGAWFCTGRRVDELSYTLTVTPGDEVVEIHQCLTNESGRSWDQSLAFNCFNPVRAEAVQDHECLRHWVGKNGKITRLITQPRQFGPRPTIQFYSVNGAPPGQDVPFVDAFKATPADLTLEGWMAIQSIDGSRLIAIVSHPALFLFQNMEYSCIHSGAGFGPLAPGETGQAVTRLYFVESSLEAWYESLETVDASIR
jgi:hypothetical protein